MNLSLFKMFSTFVELFRFMLVTFENFILVFVKLSWDKICRLVLELWIFPQLEA